MNVSQNHSKNNSLTEWVAALIWADRGFSIVNSISSGGIPSPIHESKDFQKMIEMDNENGSTFNSWKIKKIEFSDENISKHKKKKDRKNNGDRVKTEEELLEEEDNKEFTYSTLERLIFGNDEEVKLDSLAFSRWCNH